jgi:hypothetical protein
MNICDTSLSVIISYIYLLALWRVFVLRCLLLSLIVDLSHSVFLRLFLLILNPRYSPRSSSSPHFSSYCRTPVGCPHRP